MYSLPLSILTDLGTEIAVIPLIDEGAMSVGSTAPPPTVHSLEHWYQLYANFALYFNSLLNLYNSDIRPYWHLVEIYVGDLTLGADDFPSIATEVEDLTNYIMVTLNSIAPSGYEIVEDTSTKTYIWQSVV